MLTRQQSFQHSNIGQLYIVPTPIGNLEDITLRALRILREADMIAAEDTRQTQKLLNHFEIDTKTVSYHEHNKEKSGQQLLQELINGKVIALVSDAGMPGISDPGYELIKAAIEKQIPVIPLPGANAAITALVASGLQTDHFYFYGFLDRKLKIKKEQLESVKKITDTIIFYESPHRLKDTLEAMLDVLGDRSIVLCRELTKKFEEFLRGTISECLEAATNEQLKGEFCIIIEGNTEKDSEESEWWRQFSVKEHVEYYITKQALPSKEAIKLVAKERNMPKREVYEIYHIR